MATNCESPWTPTARPLGAPRQGQLYGPSRRARPVIPSTAGCLPESVRRASARQPPRHRGGRRCARRFSRQPLPGSYAGSFGLSPFDSASFSTCVGGWRTSVKRFLAAWCVAILLSLCHLTPMAAAQPGEASGNAPILAYYYQWFTPKSWSRAKIDYPLAGRYSATTRRS